MTTSGTTSVGRELIAAFGDGDWERLRSVVADGMVYEETGTGRRLEGAAAYLALCHGWKEVFPDLTGRVERELSGDGWTALEVMWTGTQPGAMEGPLGTLPATGRYGETRATLWMRTEDGRVAEIHHHLDLMGLLRNLGAVPA